MDFDNRHGDWRENWWSMNVPINPVMQEFISSAQYRWTNSYEAKKPTRQLGQSCKSYSKYWTKRTLTLAVEVEAAGRSRIRP
jgi:hypothetical protein